jgi:hypothetical protein
MTRKIPPFTSIHPGCAFPGNFKPPMVYFHNSSGALGRIQRELDWKIMDFCRIQQIIHSKISKSEDRIDSSIALRKDEIENRTEHDLGTVRFLESINAESASNFQTFQFANQMTIIGLWAISEQTMGFVYKKMVSLIDGKNEKDIKVPYKFDDFKKKFAKLGINFEILDTFVDADECRTLNNSIKHGHTIDSYILDFPYFKPLAGKKIMDVDFELQRYVTGVVQFLSSLIEEGNFIIDPTHPRHPK